MARAIGEGIETMRQHQSLFDLGVAYGQGFFYAQPMPGIDIEELLRQGFDQNPQLPEPASIGLPAQRVCG